VKDELAKAKSEDRAKQDVKSPSSIRGDLTNRGEGRNSATGDEASAISGSDSELLSSSASQNSGSELVEQRTASDDDLDSDFKFDFLTFALMVVPQVRQRLTDLQSNKMLRYFCHFDRAGQGKLTIPQCLEVGRCIGIDQHGFMQALESKGNGADTLVEFDAFASSIFKSREQAERLARERELQIRDLTGIDHVLFGEFRLIIIQLHEVFMNLSEEVGSVGTTAVRVLTYANCLGAVREIGLMPSNPRERQDVENILSYHEQVEEDGDDDSDSDVGGEKTLVQLEIDDLYNQEFSFSAFVQVLKKIRKYLTTLQVAEARRSFQSYDKDRSGALSIAEISSLLEEVGCVPHSRKEQEELAQLIHSVDNDGNGSIDFEEFQDLIQRIEEKFSAMRYEEEVEYALSAGFAEMQLSEFRGIFDMFDADGSRSLDREEVRLCLTALQKPVSGEAFENAFHILDADQSGSLEFLEFIDFMKLLRDGEGIFAEDQQHRLAEQAIWLEDRVLRSALGHLNISKSFLYSVDRDKLIDLFCVSFVIKPKDLFQDKLNIRSTQELFAYAKNMYASDSAGMGF